MIFWGKAPIIMKWGGMSLSLVQRKVDLPELWAERALLGGVPVKGFRLGCDSRKLGCEASYSSHHPVRGFINQQFRGCRF